MELLDRHVTCSLEWKKHAQVFFSCYVNYLCNRVTFHCDDCRVGHIGVLK